MKLLLSILAVIFLTASTAFALPTRVIIVGWDGAAYKEVRAMYDGGKLPNLAALGSLSKMYISGITSTKPSWAKIFTGLGAEETGVWSNTAFNPIPRGLTLFERLKTTKGAYNIFIAGKQHNLDIKNNEPYTNAVWAFDAYSVKNQDMHKVYSTAKSFLTNYSVNYSTQPLLAFIHTGEPDYQGHSFGVESPEYANKIMQLDALLGSLQKKLIRLGLNNTKIIVASDHGFNHLYVPFPRPGKGSQNQHHRLAPYGIVTSNFAAFPQGLSNMEVTNLILGLFATPPVP